MRRGSWTETGVLTGCLFGFILGFGFLFLSGNETLTVLLFVMMQIVAIPFGILILVVRLISRRPWRTGLYFLTGLLQNALALTDILLLVFNDDMNGAALGVFLGINGLLGILICRDVHHHHHNHYNDPQRKVG